MFENPNFDTEDIEEQGDMEDNQGGQGQDPNQGQEGGGSSQN